MSDPTTRICIFGMGYVGCVTGACLAAMGHTVTGVEPNRAKTDLINAGKSPIIEADIDTLINSVVRDGRFKATDDWRRAVADSELAMVCVGTPSRPNGSIDLGYVSRVCEQIGQALRERKQFFTVVIRSTVVPGTVDETLIPILERESGRRAGVDFGVCMNPEFLREGTSVHDFHHPPKTVVGELNAASGEPLTAIYARLPAPLVRTTLRVAETVKYVDNAFHALKVTFANEVGNLCKEMRVDSHQVMDIFCRDTKLNLSPTYLKPGFAFGGSCLPKDLRALIYTARTHDLQLPVIGSIIESNRLQVSKIIRKLTEFKERTLGFLGLSFKGGTDDLRESPIVAVIEAMIGKGFAVRIFDRNVSLARLTGANKQYIEKEIPHISRLMCASVDELMAGSDVIVVGNRSSEFASAISGCEGRHTIIDLVRIMPEAPSDAAAYYGICW